MRVLAAQNLGVGLALRDQECGGSGKNLLSVMTVSDVSPRDVFSSWKPCNHTREQRAGSSEREHVPCASYLGSPAANEA